MLTPEFLHQLKLTFKGIAELYCCSNFLISNNFTLHVARKWIEGKVTIIKMKKSTILFGKNPKGGPLGKKNLVEKNMV